MRRDDDSGPAGTDDRCVQKTTSRLVSRLRRDDAQAQFARFVAVGGIANVLYALVFVLLADLGSTPANLAGALTSSVLANELHRRLTFSATGRVTWLEAQWEGGGLALAGIAATTVALDRFDALVPGSSAAAHLALVALVTGAVGLVRFAALRWVFRAPAGPVTA